MRMHEKQRFKRAASMSITHEEYNSFIAQAPLFFGQLSPDISQLKRSNEINQATLVAATLFESLIITVKERLSNPAEGIATVDIPENDHLDATANAYWGVVLALSLTRNIFEPARDKVNAIYNSCSIP